MPETSIDAATVGQFLSVGKMGIGIVRWFIQQRKKKAEATIDQYLEWLRRHEHQETISQLNDSTELMNIVKDLISTLTQHSEESANQILIQIKESESTVSGKLEGLTKEIVELKEQVRLFDPALSLSKEVQEFEESYLRQISREFGKMQMLGVREMRDIKQSLSVAYVALRLKTDSEDDDASLRASEILTCEKLLAMRGPAGSGKSTLLSWVAYQCTELEDQKNPWRGGVPFFVPLRRLDSKDGGEPDLRRLVSYTIDPKVWAVEPPTNWCNTVLTQKRAVLLIDGVDELSSELRPKFWGWLKTFTENYPGNRIYVTSRYPCRQPRIAGRGAG